MKVNDFAVEVSKKEGGKKEQSIAQIKETLRCANDLLCGELYRLIRKCVYFKKGGEK